MSRTICLDFDGVLHSYTSGWKGIDIIPDPPVVDTDTGVNAIDWVTHLVTATENGKPSFKVCIYSARSREASGRQAMKDWFRKHGMLPSVLKCITFATQKPKAFLTIDDRAICFEGKFPTKLDITSFVPWNKKK